MLSQPAVHATNSMYLPYLIDDVEHQCNKPGQNQYADDDRIHIAMDMLEYVHRTSLFSDCAGGCSPAASCTACWAMMSQRRSQVSFTRPIWANRTRIRTFHFYCAINQMMNLTVHIVSADAQKAPTSRRQVSSHQCRIALQTITSEAFI